MAHRILLRTASWLARWGFAALVSIALLLGACSAATVGLPEEIPSYALQAAPVYRIEVGAAVFAVGYISSLALVLALGNRAFSELGPSGVKVHDLHDVRQDEVIKQHEELLDALAVGVSELKGAPTPNNRPGSE